MTLKDLLERIDITDKSIAARLLDGSGGRDTYEFVINIDGHGEPLNAEVRKIRIGEGSMYLHLNGDKGA